MWVNSSASGLAGVVVVGLAVGVTTTRVAVGVGGPWVGVAVGRGRVAVKVGAMMGVSVARTIFASPVGGGLVRLHPASQLIAMVTRIVLIMARCMKFSSTKKRAYYSIKSRGVQLYLPCDKIVLGETKYQDSALALDGQMEFLILRPRYWNIKVP
jgi:hypothetical protein